MNLDLFTFTYYYGNGDYYTGQGYAEAGTYAASQVLTGYANEMGYEGSYTIDSVVDSDYDPSSGYNNYVYVTSYYDGDTSFSSYSAVGYGYSGLGSESGTVTGLYSSDSFSNYDEADLDYYYPPTYYDQYNFTYYYGNGDSYSGHGYAVAGTYYSGQTLDSYWNETGNNGYYIIDSVYSFSGSSDGEVYVNSYYDGDTSFSSYYAEGYGYSGLGSESGTVYGYYFYDSFSTYDEADLDYYYPPTYYDQYNFTYYYGNGDSYSGHGYAVAGTYYSGQTLDSYWNETGNNGYYIIDSVYSFSGSSDGEVYVNSYYDGDTGYGYASSVFGYGYYGLGSESGTVSGYYSSDSFSTYDEADLDYYYPPTYYDQYNFTYYYGNGDSYSGHGSAIAGTYYAGQTVDSNWNETGNYGYYTIDSVYSGIGSSDGEVYVTGYYDGDTGYGYASSVSGYGFSGLGSESGTVSGFYSSDDFSNYSEADLYSYYSYDQYNFTYYYGNGDSYSGYGYILTGTYYAGQTISPYPNETGNEGYYYIDSVYFGIGVSADGHVYVTSYTDGDTSLSTYLVSGFGYVGLGSESGTVSGSSSSDSFSNYYEADLLNSSPTLANDLASAILGNGVAIINPSFIGDSRAASLFNDSSLGIGITSGIILSTGDVANIYGPNDSDSTSTALGTNGDDDLNSLVTPSSTLDAAVLEFDFVPTQNFLSFSYVFASEEYNEYVNSSFNDVFGFFLTDSLGNKQNIAIIPGTTTPIAINNINLGSNPAYYRNNDPSDYGFGTTPFNTEFDGLTTVLTAIANVNPGETYRFKLAIADNTDRVLDSAVFITGGTFETTPIVAVNDSVKVNQGQPITINVLGNDLVAGSEIPIIADFQVISDNGGTITLFDNGTPDNLSDDQLIYAPSTGFTGVDEFKYTLADSAGNTHTAGVYVEVSPVSVLVSDFYYFTYYYGDGSQDYYEGYGYVAGGTYHEGQIISLSPNETGNNGYYTIGAVYSGYTGVEDEVTVTSYYDVDTGYGSVDSIFGSDSSILGTESGNVYDANGNSFDSQFSNYYEADIVKLSDFYYFTYYYGDGNQDYYEGYGYVEGGTYTEGQIISLFPNETGNNGYYTIGAVYSGYIGVEDEVTVTSYYDIDTGYGSVDSIFGSDSSILGTESGNVYDANGNSFDSQFSNYYEADIVKLSDFYYFTYYYGDGNQDYYEGYGYVAGGTYYEGQIISPYPNEIGSYGYYTIGAVYSGYIGVEDEVTVTSYYDVDTGYGSVDSIFGSDSSILGTESGNVYDANGNSFDSQFSNYYEADLISSNNHSVYYLTDYLSWLDAQAQAQAMGGNLATINNATENQFLANVFGNDNHWIGYTDQAEEGVWQWISGETSNYTNWDGPEPNNLDDEDFAEFYSNGYWNDLASWQTRRGIVEVVGGVSTLSISDVSVAENGSYSVLIPVTLKGITNQIFTVDYSLAPGGTATENQDYAIVPETGTLTFNPGDSVQYIVVFLEDDDVSEGNETFFVNLSNVTGGAVLDQSTATVTIAENEKYTFTYTYGNGDSYSGHGYALAGTYAAGQVLSGYSNETDNDGYYTIDSVEDIGELGTEGLVYVTSYTDGDTGFGTTTSISGYYWWYVDVNGYYGLGSESGYAYNANNSGDNYFSNYHEADLPGVVQVRLNLLADDGGNPGELIANNQIGVNKSFFVEILVADLRGNAVGVNGLGLDLSWDGFILESINFDPSLDITSQFPLLQDGTLVYDGFIDDLSGGSLPAFELGQAIGVNQLERFALLRFYTENSSNGTSYLTTTVSSAALADDASYSLDVEEYQPIEILASYNQYNFTYNYGNGDFYTGYVYALEGIYAAGQVLSGYPNETGNEGFYTIDSIGSSTFDSWYNNQVYVTSYYDGDTGYGLTTNIGEADYPWWDGIHGYYGLGSEQGYAYDTNGNSSDPYFGYNYEADIFANQKFNYTYHYGNGDSYSGYGYAAVGTYTADQVIGEYSNETGFSGYYVIDSVELGNTNSGYNGYVYITSYYDGDTGYGTTTNIGEDWWTADGIHGYSGLGSESGYAYDTNGNSSDPYFSYYSEADILNQYYTFTYTYGNGDSYSGHGYALAGTYAAEQVLSGYWNETGNYGYYTINSVSAGTTDSSYNNRVYVTSYTDGDTGYGLTTNIGEADYPWWDGIHGSSGLGSEQGYAYDTNGNSYDSYFSNSSEADIFANQKFYYTYHYGNGDSYTGYGYAAVGTYTAGQELWNETGNNGYYTIDSVELGNNNPGYNGYVYITSYTDGDTSYAYGTTTNIGEDWWTADGIHGYSGLGSESGHAYTADGYSYDSYFDNSNEADLIVPSISITDNSDVPDDASIKFTTELSPFRKNYSYSDFVRPNYADSTKYFDITNTGTAVLTVSGLQINVAGVTTDLDLTKGDLLLNPNESQRVQLTYKAAAAKEVFNRSDALVLFTDAVNLPEVAIALSGKSTFNSDINYDGIVGTGDLGPLNQARVNYNKGILDPTADINGDGMINSLDVSVLLSENKQSVFI